jgi:glycosyltransferase involved in cell wall biosynthesis
MDQSEARRRLGLPERVLLIGYIGAIFHGDAVLMAEAFDRIHQDEPRARLLLIGYCNAAVEDLVSTPAAVWRTGRVQYNEINPYLAACDLCWLPMRETGANQGRSPLKIKDYMAAGRPVVVTDVGDVADLVRRGKFGLLAPDQPQELARETLKLLHMPQNRQAMGRRARQLAEEDFSWYRIAGQLERFYRELIR